MPVLRHGVAAEVEKSHVQFGDSVAAFGRPLKQRERLLVVATLEGRVAIRHRLRTHLSTGQRQIDDKRERECVAH